MKSPSFTDHYSLSQYIIYRDHQDARPKNTDGSPIWDGAAYNEWSDGYRIQHEALESSIESFLIAKSKFSPLAKIAFAKDRGHSWSDAWNSLSNGDAVPNTLKSVTRSLGRSFMTSVIRIKSETQNKVADHLSLCAAADAGNFEWFDLDTRRACLVTGQDLCVELKGWVPTLGVYDYKNKLEPFVALKSELPLPQVRSHVINVPSGELLISDWFRIEAFTETVKNSKDDFDINNQTGKHEQTEWYAKKYGFMSVCVGNTCPKLIEREGQIVVASLTESESGLKGRQAGYVCTDLWWATAIDRQVLTDIIATSIPRDEAERQVADYLDTKNNHNIVTTLNVRPGQYHVYHTAKPVDMSEFKSTKVSTAGIDQLYGVISQEELSWTPKKTSVATRRPRMR